MKRRQQQQLCKTMRHRARTQGSDECYGSCCCCYSMLKNTTEQRTIQWLLRDYCAALMAGWYGNQWTHTSCIGLSHWFYTFVFTCHMKHTRWVWGGFIGGEGAMFYIIIWFNSSQVILTDLSVTLSMCPFKSSNFYGSTAWIQAHFYTRVQLRYITNWQ